MELNIPAVLKTVLEDYALPLNGDHGVAHWARVLENGLRLAEKPGQTSRLSNSLPCCTTLGGRTKSLIHEHGPRAAEFAWSYVAASSISTTMSSDCCTRLVTVTRTNARIPT